MAEKVAVVVGGGSGMGAAAARKLAQDGFRIAILCRSRQTPSPLVPQSAAVLLS
jgi:NAD(P)-dependent dehydrogenase (short-subunit alcohol dehydrogenase family)